MKDLWSKGLGDHPFVQLMSNFPPVVPAALARQHAMAHQRGVRGRDQDETASQSGSVSSWDQVGEDEPVQADANRLGSIPEGSAAVPKAPPPPAAPVTQAAHGLLNYENEPAHQRKLRKQQERAQRRGYRNARSGQMGGVHNAANLQLPPHLRLLPPKGVWLQHLGLAHVMLPSIMMMMMMLDRKSICCHPSS